MYTIFEIWDLDPRIAYYFLSLGFGPQKCILLLNLGFGPQMALGVVPPGTFPDPGKFRHSRDNIFELKTYCHIEERGKVETTPKQRNY